MKRIISALLILLMLIPPMVLPAHAAEAGQADSVVYMTTDKQTVSVGDTVTVTVNYENIPASSSVDFSLVYDTTYFNTPVDNDITYNINGQKAKNATGTVDERFSKDLAGKQAIKVVAASDGNCLKATSGSLFSVKFTVKANAPAPGIPLQFVGSFNNLYSEEDMSNTIQVVNTHIPTATSTKTVSSISLTSAPTKTSYVQGQALNLEGGRIKVTYSDRSTKEVFLSLAEVTQYDPNKVGTQTVKASYAGKEVSFTIETEAATLSSIEVGKAPDKVEYIVNKDTTLDKTGGVLLLNYTGGVTKTLDMADASVVVSGFNPNISGAQTIQVQYNGFETSYKIAIVKKALSAIDVVTPMICDTCGQEQDAFALIQAAGGDTSEMKFNKRMEYIKDAANNVTCLKGCGGKTFSTKMKMVYYLNQPFDVENAKLRVTYSDNTTEDIDMTLDMVIFHNAVATTQSVEVVYGSQWTLISNIRTQKKKASSISVSQTPKTSYIQGQPFDPTGGKILVNYTDGSQEEISMGSSGVTFSYSNLNELGQHRVTVSYDGKSASFDVHVGMRAVVSIAVDANAKSTYVEGQALEQSTKLNVTYNDGKTEVDYFVNATITGYNPNQVGAQLVTITYGGIQTTWVVTVEAKKVTGISVTAPSKTEYIQGQDLVLTGGKITANYDNGDVVSNISITANMISGYDKTQVGTQTVTVTYEGKTATFTVQVIARAVESITITPPSKTEYIEGQDLVLTGGTVTATYNDGSKGETADITSAMISGYNKNQVGSQIVTVTYEGKTKTFTVNVVAKAVTSITITAPSKTAYIQGQELDLAGGKITATYNDGSVVNDISITAEMISGYNKSKTGSQTVTVTYGGQTATFTVNVVARVISKITVTAPTKTEYIEGQALDLAGSKIIATYNDGSEEEKSINLATVSGYDPNQVGDQIITVAYQGKTATFIVKVIARAVESITVTAPTKTEYIQGQELDLAGGKIIATYNDGSQEEKAITSYDGYNKNQVGTQTITVTYEGKTATFTVTVIAKVVTEITVTAPTKTEYIEGQDLNLEGGKITATYNDGSVVENISITSVSGYDKNQVGTQTITVTYGGQSATFTVKVIARAVERIEVTAPTKVEYYVGQDLDLAGGTVTAIYNDGSKGQATAITSAMISGYDKTQVGTQTITVTYEGKTTTFAVNVFAKVVTEITITAPAKTEYIEGQELNLTGGTVTAIYNDGSKGEPADITSAMISGYNKNQVGSQIVTVTYGGQTDTFTVQVIAKVVTEIAVTAPTKTEYIEGQELDLTGGKIIATYNDGSQEEKSITSYDGYNKDQVGTQTITVTYEGKTATFTVKVIARVVTGITVTAPAKTEYIEGQELDLAGGKIIATYNDGSQEEKTITSYDGYNKNQVGTQTITVTYEGKTATFTVKVIARVVDSITVIAPTKTEYIEGQELDLAGGKIIATYNDGSEEEKSITSVSGYDKNQVGTQTITVAYEGKIATFTVNVIAKVVTEITVTAPTKTEYIEGQDLNLEGGKITAIYNDGSVVENISITSFDGYNKNQVGTQTITVTYEGKTATFTVTVIARVVTGITVTAPTKTEYIQGKDLNLAGGTITATYNDGSTETVDLSSGVIDGYEKNQVGTQTVTVIYGGQTATFTVEVIEKVVTKIEITTPLTKVEYYKGQALNLTGSKITATYNDGSKKIVQITADMISGYEKNQLGTQTVTVTYEGKTATFTVKVVARVVDSITVTAPTKTEYIEGQELDLAGGKVTAIYKDGGNETVDLSLEMISGYNPNQIGVQYLTVVYGGKTANFEVKVIAKVVTGITVTAPNKTEYIEGQDLDLAGGTITATYNDDSKGEATAITSAMISGYKKNQVGTQTVTVTYEGKTATFTVKVVAKKAVEIKVSTKPQTEYLVGKHTALNLVGGKLTVTYDNKTTEIVDLSKATVRGFDKNRIGTQTIAVSYLGLSTEYKINMNQKEIESIAISALPTKMTYRQGVEKFDPTGGKFIVYYNNDTKETLNFSDATIKGFSNLFVETITLTLSYKGFTDKFRVTILAENPFVDVPADAYYTEPVLWAVEKGITNGTSETTFSPDADCTRGQIVTFLWRAAGSPKPESSKNPFKDVKKDAYYYNAVLWAVEKGITTGTSANTFSPDAACTRGQVVTFLWRANGEPKPKSSKNTFKDVKKAEYYYNAVLWAVENGITNGTGENTFSPADTCTRGQIVTFLYRFYN